MNFTAVHPSIRAHLLTALVMTCGIAVGCDSSGEEPTRTRATPVEANAPGTGVAKTATQTNASAPPATTPSSNNAVTTPVIPNGPTPSHIIDPHTNLARGNVQRARETATVTMNRVHETRDAEPERPRCRGSRASTKPQRKRCMDAKGFFIIE